MRASVDRTRAWSLTRLTLVVTIAAMLHGLPLLFLVCIATAAAYPTVERRDILCKDPDCSKYAFSLLSLLSLLSLTSFPRREWRNSATRKL